MFPTLGRMLEEGGIRVVRRYRDLEGAAPGGGAVENRVWSGGCTEVGQMKVGQ